MDSLLVETVLILFLLLVNGIFAMTEIAIISSRKDKLTAKARQGSKGAQKALELAENPDKFLSTLQIGITLVGITAGAYGGARIADQLAKKLKGIAAIGEYATPISFILVIGVITYLTLILGELVPKRLALRFSEPIASAVSGAMAFLSKVCSPLVWLLSSSTSSLLTLIGIKEIKENGISRHDIQVLVREGMIAGSIDSTESRMMEKVLTFKNLVAYDIMIPRPRIYWIDIEASHQDIWPEIIRSTQDVFPVYEGDRDNLRGSVSIKDIYAHLATDTHISFRDIMQPVLRVNENDTADALLQHFRTSGQRAAFVSDEFGGISGMVTLKDLMESVFGDIPSKAEKLRQPIRKKTDGTWQIDGLFEIEKLAEHLEDFHNPSGAGDTYQTINGWFTHEKGHLPDEGDSLTHSGWIFRVTTMDGPRIAKVLAKKMQIEE